MNIRNIIGINRIYNLKQKLKCIFEQLVIITFIALTLLILGSILSSISYNLFSSLPNNIYRPIHHILEAIYLILCLILSITLTLHIFKVRYLDYYQIINVDKQEPIINIPSEPQTININKHLDELDTSYIDGINFPIKYPNLIIFL